MAYSKRLWDVISGNFPGGQNYNPATSSFTSEKKWEKEIQEGFTTAPTNPPATNNDSVVFPKPKTQPAPKPNNTYGNASAVWEAISGIKVPENKALSTLETRDRFHKIFGGGGQVDISHTKNKDIAGQYYSNLGYHVIDNSQQTASSTTGTSSTSNSAGLSQNDIDEMLKKIHGLHPDNLAPNANKWALDYFHKRLQSLTPEQRSYLSDPNVPEADKLIKLKDWTSFQTIDDVNEYAKRLKEEEGIGAGAFGGWQGYNEFLKQVNANDPYSQRISTWHSDRSKYLSEHGLTADAQNTIDPILYDWYFINQQWKQGADNDPKTLAYRYKNFQGDFEGFYKQRIKDLINEGVIGHDIDINKYLSGDIEPGSYFYGYNPEITPPGYSNPQPTATIENPPPKPIPIQNNDIDNTLITLPDANKLQDVMTNILNLLQLENTYKPSEEAINKLMNPYVATEPYKEQIGSIMNKLANRGVINSTITSNALEKLSRTWLDRARELQERGILSAEELKKAAAAQELTAKNLAARLALDKYMTDLNAWLRNKSIDLDAWLRNKNLDLDEAFRRDTLGEEIRKTLFDEAFNTAKFGWMTNRQQWLDTIEAYKDLLGIEESDWSRKTGSYGTLDELFQKDRDTLYRELFKLWDAMLSGRYQIPTTITTQSGGVSPFISFLAPVIGKATGNIAEAGLGAILDALGIGAGNTAAGMGTTGATTLLADTLGSLGIGGTTAGILAGLAML